MDSQGCDYNSIIDGASHRHSFCSYYCLYGKSIFQLRFISWVSMFFSAPVYMLMVSRVNKRFVSLTYLTILGVFFLLTGNLFRFGRPTMRGGTMEAGILSQRKEINLRMGDGEPVL